MTEEGTQPVPDVLVAGKYQLTRLLGQGGMGSVWEGVHTSLGTRVAVKFIDADYADSLEARNRFVNEAKAAARLQSKHVVQVYDQGVMEDGRPYIVMEFLAGEPLDKKLEREGRLGPGETAQLIVHVSRALTKAHQAGIVHRDLKPENVFLVWDEEDHANVGKVVDFGIAKFTDGGLTGSSATRTGSVLGTPHYMSPEQARGLRSVNFKSDIWSVGVIAYRCVVGRLPFDGEAVGDLLVKICTAPLPVPSQMVADLPPAFDAWFARCLSREPSERFESAAEMADQLCAALGVATGRGPMPSAMLGAPSTVGSNPHAAPSAETVQAPTPMPGIGPTPNTINSVTTHTHTAGVPTAGGRGALFAVLGVVGVLAIVGIGWGVMAAGGDDRPAEPAASAIPEPPEETTPPAEPATTSEPEVAPAVASEDAGAEPEPSTEPAETKPKPRSGPSRPRPVSRPVVKPTPAPAPKPGPKPKGGVDLGY